jgi:hypothetical protein
MIETKLWGSSTLWGALRSLRLSRYGWFTSTCSCTTDAVHGNRREDAGCSLCRCAKYPMP